MTTIPAGLSSRVSRWTASHQNLLLRTPSHYIHHPSTVASSIIPLTTFIRTLATASSSTGSSASSTGSSNISGSTKSKLQKAKRIEKKKTVAQLIKIRNGPTFHIDEALRILKALSISPFNSTVDIQIQLGIDPRKTNIAIRGVAALPYGTGKPVRIAVFARGDKAEEAKKAGATIVGAEDLVERINKGELNFDRTIATPDVMPLVGKVARVLGPRGLMPNPKLGTVTMNVKDAVLAAKRGQAEFRAEKRGIVSAPVGKVSFTLPELKENIKAVLLALYEVKPEGFKGSYYRQIVLSTTHGPGIPLDLSIVDPSSSSFMSTWNGVPTSVVNASSLNSSGSRLTTTGEGEKEKVITSTILQ